MHEFSLYMHINYYRQSEKPQGKMKSFFIKAIKYLFPYSKGIPTTHMHCLIVQHIAYNITHNIHTFVSFINCRLQTTIAICWSCVCNVHDPLSGVTVKQLVYNILHTICLAVHNHSNYIGC